MAALDLSEFKTPETVAFRFYKLHKEKQLTFQNEIISLFLIIIENTAS
jgi:hypothetical protein